MAKACVASRHAHAHTHGYQFREALEEAHDAKDSEEADDADPAAAAPGHHVDIVEEGDCDYYQVCGGCTRLESRDTA